MRFAVFARLSQSCGALSLLLALSLSPLEAQKKAAALPGDSWVGTWSTSAVGVPNREGSVAQNEILYQTVRLSRGGSALRVVFTNEFGTDPLIIRGARVSLLQQGAQPAAGSDRALSFNGEAGTTVPAGAIVLSDPISLAVAPLSELSIRLSLPSQPQHIITAHTLGLQTNREAPGDAILPAPPAGAQSLSQWHFLKSVEVRDGAPMGAAIVALGDSITDGYRSTPDTNHRWPDLLAARLATDPRLRDLGVLNEGISGNRVLHDGAGPNALARFDRDVLSQDGVRYLILMEGINDIGHTAQPRNPDDRITTQQLIAGLTQIVERAHAHGIRVFGATLTPFLGAGYASPEGETMRQAVNTWTRTSGTFDGVIDFDRITRDPADESHFAAAFDSGDHLHPNDAGYGAMANGIDLKLFTPARP